MPKHTGGRDRSVWAWTSSRRSTASATRASSGSRTRSRATSRPRSTPCTTRSCAPSATGARARRVRGRGLDRRIVVNEARRRAPRGAGDRPGAALAEPVEAVCARRSACCPSASGSHCSCATTPTSTTRRSPRRSGSRAGRSRRRCTPPIRPCRRTWRRSSDERAARARGTPARRRRRLGAGAARRPCQPPAPGRVAPGVGLGRGGRCRRPLRGHAVLHLGPRPGRHRHRRRPALLLRDRPGALGVPRPPRGLVRPARPDGRARDLQGPRDLGRPEDSDHGREIYSSLLTGYRDALRSGTAKELGGGWINIAPGHDVKVSKDTYRPVAMRVGGHETRILAYETIESLPQRIGS